jgi:hypothetical protein
VQAPFWQESPKVQALPSLQDVPFGKTGLLHAPVDGSQVPAPWQASLAVHTREVPPTHWPDWQLSLLVQALPSLQAVPFGAAGFVQTPVTVLQVPATWQESDGVQVTAVPVQAPATQ